jgi:putative exosortase-associated protein (TIGR04073 family)
MAYSIIGYAQAESNPAVANIAASGINPYRLTPLDSHQATINYINSTEDVYRDTPVEKISEGIVNTTTSWADVPAKIAEVSEKDNIFLGATLGFGEGIVSGVARGTSGVIDMVTFGLPPYDKPLMEPQYKVTNPDEGFKIDILRW